MLSIYVQMSNEKCGTFPKLSESGRHSCLWGILISTPPIKQPFQNYITVQGGMLTR